MNQNTIIYDGLTHLNSDLYEAVLFAFNKTLTDDQK